MQKNNLDLIRIIAALQVAIAHGFRFIPEVRGPLQDILEFLPGVPILFFISGFLISASFERSPGLKKFAEKRALRIFPALWFCLLGTLALLYLTGYMASKDISITGVLSWLAAQASILQFYNPDFARHYGAGIVNPALWTICVELQFYIVTPIIIQLFRRWRPLFWGAFALMVVTSFAYNYYLDPLYGNATAVKLLGVTFLPWIAMFMVGNLTYFYWPQIHPIVEGKFAYWAVAYALVIAAGYSFQTQTGIFVSGNRLSIVIFAFLAGLILSCAYSMKGLASVLRGTDISYGLYLWHMPIIGTWLYLDLPRTQSAVFACLVIALLTAGLSWFLIEKPALKRKPRKSAALA